MLYFTLAILALVAVVYLIVKKVHAAASIFTVGFFLLMLAAWLDRAGSTKQEIESTGNAFYDQLLVIGEIFSSRFTGIGMAIMVLFGFVAYMRHIGADAKAVVLLSRPLRGLKGSYWLVPLGFVIGNLLSLVVPSASALSLLLVATLLPALIAAGLTPLTVAAIVVTSSTIMPTPLEAGLIQGAKLLGMPISEYVFLNVAKATVPALVITAFVHMFWQRFCDQRDARKLIDAHAGAGVGGSGAVDKETAETAAHGDVHALEKAHAADSDAAVRDALERAAGLPGFYALLPLMPLVLIVLSALAKAAGWIQFEADILPVTVVSLMLSMVIEAIRHRDVRGAIDDTKDFFKGMGEGAASVVALLVAAAVLIEGITQMGVVSSLISFSQSTSGGGALIVLLFVISTGVIAALTGSGTAPYFAFAEIVPGLAAPGSGINPVMMLTSIWGTSNLMRQVSPVNAALLIGAGAIKVNPMRLVVRTSVPMITATVLNVVFAFLFV